MQPRSFPGIPSPTAEAGFPPPREPARKFFRGWEEHSRNPGSSFHPSVFCRTISWPASFKKKKNAQDFTRKILI